MALVNSAIDAVLRAFYAAFGWAPPALGLTVLSAAAGVGMLWIFRRTSNQERMKAVKRRVYASLLELRVYSDEPRLIGQRHRLTIDPDDELWIVQEAIQVIPCAQQRGPLFKLGRLSKREAPCGVLQVT